MVLRDAMVGLVRRRRDRWANRAPSDAGDRSAVRVAIKRLHRIWFRRTGPPLALARVGNISTTGIGLVRDHASEWPEPGDSIGGDVLVEHAAYPVVLRVVHVTRDVVGCEFGSPSRALTSALEEHLQLELARLTVANGLPEAPDGVPHWFHGDDSSQLYLVERDGHVLRFRLAFHGNCLEGGLARPVRFGVIAGNRRIDRDDDDSIHWLDMIDAEQFALTVRVISWIPGLERLHRDGILRYIS